MSLLPAILPASPPDCLPDFVAAFYLGEGNRLLSEALELARWAPHRSVGAEHAALSGQRLEDAVALPTFIEMHACVCRHQLLTLKAAPRTSDSDGEDELGHGSTLVANPSLVSNPYRVAPADC